MEAKMKKRRFDWFALCCVSNTYIFYKKKLTSYQQVYQQFLLITF